MKPVECPYEAEVLSAVLEARWPGHVDAALRAHAANCGICSEVASVAGALAGSREELRTAAPVPDASRVWWRAQLRARREAVQAAGRPISAVQAIAFACAVGVLGACFGAASKGFQAALTRVAAGMPALDLAALRASASGLLNAHGELLLVVAAVVLVVPTAVCLVLAKD
jgi:hypothetical protein